MREREQGEPGHSVGLRGDLRGRLLHRLRPGSPSKPVRVMRTSLALLIALTASFAARASGHGPVYGLATPTLGEGGWSIDVAAMYRLNGAIGDGSAQRAMLRPMLGYGITEDLQLSLSAPMPLYIPAASGLGPGRMMAMMPSSPDTEALLAWRFTRNGNDVGSRIESTA